MLYKSTNLTGYRLNSLDGEIGKVKEFFFDDRYWTIRYLIADTGNWLTGRQVLISPYALGAVNQEDQNIAIQLTKTQIEDSPPLESNQPVSRQFEESHIVYYGLTAYWTGFGGQEDWDPNLLSTSAVIGHHVQASDDEIGHVEDFIIDDKTWAIRYLVINTRNWLPGKKILISPQWIERVSWTEAKVFVNLTRETIKEAPEYDDDAQITRDYELALYKHFTCTGYWVDEQDAEKPDEND